MPVGFVDTLRPFLIATLVPASGLAALALVRGPGNGAIGPGNSVIMFILVWIYTLVPAAILVLPILLVIPRARKPTYLAGAVWGIAVAELFHAVFESASSPPLTFWEAMVRWRPSVAFAMWGAACGLVYVFAACKLERKAQ